MTLAPGTRLGPYEIVGAIGAGGMGEVYRAKDTRLSREVAIKILPADLVNDPERRARFEREAQIVSALNHPHIVTLYEVGTSEAGPYLVLEKIEGQSLRELLNAGPLPIRRLVALAAQIAEGLAKAHSVGIVHRDLKPDNVMVTADGFAKILDFGLAKLVWPELHGAEEDTTLARDTASGMILGTLGYLSPEQAAGKPADERADQFALGALLYEMATRERLFRRETMAESLAATIRDEAPPLRSKRAEVPQQFAWIVERCLAKDPNDRYASTRDLARDLADVRDRLSDLTKAQPENAVTGARPARSRWLTWALGVMSAIALVAGGYAVGRQFVGGEPPTFRALTFKRGIITGARFSPDGQTIYYSAAFGAEPSRVFVTRLDSTASEPLKLPPAMLLSVSRKGELAVLLTNTRTPAESIGTLARGPAIGGTPRPLVEEVIDADWAPDGERLAVERADFSIEFPPGHRLSDIGQFPRVSPRGDHVAWIGDHRVEIADVTGRVVVDHKIPFAFGLAWAPDGREVWFTGSETGSGYDRALFALSVAGTRRLIARAPGALTLFDVAPDGHGALVSTGAGWASIVASHQGEPQDRALDLFGRTGVKGLSADGRWVLLNETREVGRGIYLRTTDGEQTIPLRDRPGALGLSPDGAWALVSEPNPSRLQLLPTSAGSPRDVPGPPGVEATTIEYQHAQWSTDGRRLFLSFAVPGRGDQSSRLYMREGDRPWQAVTPEGVGGQFAVSPDGRMLATADATGELTLFPADGGTPRRLTGERGVPVYWSTDGQWLFLRRGMQDVPARIYRRELATGRIEPWRDIAPNDLSGVTSVRQVLLANDGAVCVYAYSRVSNELYLIQGVR
jgi:Tol biopolymer transport system component